MSGNTPSVSGPNVVIGTFTEKVVMVSRGSGNGIHMYKVEQTGDGIYDMDCTGFDIRTSPAEKWYVTDISHVYTACTQDELGSVITMLMNKKYSKTPIADASYSIAILTFPLAVGNKWQAFGDLPPSNENTSYSWYVEEKLDYVVPAGNFSDCYRIALYTLPDVSIRYFCNGIGTVAMEYHHNGTPVDYRVELSSYSLGGNP